MLSLMVRNGRLVLQQQQEKNETFCVRFARTNTHTHQPHNHKLSFFSSMSSLSVDHTLVDRPVLPGDIITKQGQQQQQQQQPIRLGPGLQVLQDGDGVMCVRAGVLRYVSKMNKYFVESYQKKVSLSFFSTSLAHTHSPSHMYTVSQYIYIQYIPMLEDMVIGVIRARGEYYRVDIGAHQFAQLHNLSFDGATKRNRPNLRVGDLVYCRVMQADRHLEANEITCQSAKNKKDWVTGESIFGQLKGGYVFECSLAMCRKLLDPQCAILRLLGVLFRFEIAVGMNGRVWISCIDMQQQQQQQGTEISGSGSSIPLDAHETTVLIATAIQNSEHLIHDDKALADFVNATVRTYLSKRVSS